MASGWLPNWWKKRKDKGDADVGGKAEAQRGHDARHKGDKT